MNESLTNSRLADTEPASPNQRDWSDAHEAPHVLVVMPYEMSARNFISTSAAGHLMEDGRVRLTVVTRDPADLQQLVPADCAATEWHSMLRPFCFYSKRWALSIAGWRRLAADLRFVAGFYLHLVLVFRFNSVNGFQGFLDRLRQSRHLRRRAFREGLPSRRWLGFPFPRSRTLLRLFKSLYYRAWQRHPAVEALFDQVRPDLVVLTHLQTALVTPYLLAARARGIRLIGINGSWDQPTTKGPLVEGLSEILAQSVRIRAELAELHGYPPDRIEVIGWPQMDVYGDLAGASPRNEFLARIGLPAGGRYLLVGAYAERLGGHEPEMCRKLAAAVAAGRFGDDVTLYIRCHPLDSQWNQRLAPLADLPRVIVEPPRLDDLQHLADLIRHAEVVISSAGTINLDAAALDRPSLAVAFEDERLPYYDRPVRRYSMEHYAAALETGGIRLVESQAALEEAIAAYIRDETLDAEGRRRLRETFLSPLDGGAARRVAAAIRRAATEARRERDAR